MQSFLGLERQRYQPRGIGGLARRRANPISLCALLTMFSMVGRAQDNICQSEVCKEVAAVYDQTVNQSVKPCQDFFTHVCSGWMENIRENLGSQPGLRSTGTLDRLVDEVIPRIVSGELRRLRKSAAEKLRDSEIQPVMFFKSCVRSIKKTNWDFNTITLRKFFHEVGLPFFDEIPICTDKSPLTTLLKLAIQFGIYPLFKVDLKGERIKIYKEAHIEKEINDNKSPEDVARDWKSVLQKDIITEAQELDILTKLGALFDAYKIRARKKVLLRWGWNYQAVTTSYEDFFHQSTDVTVHRLSTWSKRANSTYFDLLDQHMGNLVQLKGDHEIVFYPSYFEPMLIALRDEDLAPIFIDFIRVYLLKEALPNLIERTRCGLQGGECFKDVLLKGRPSGKTPVIYCAALVGAPHRR